MRSLIALFSLAVAVLASAQDRSPNQNSGPISTPGFDSKNPIPMPKGFLGAPSTYSDRIYDGTCYTLRTYIFERDGLAPKLKRMTTCMSLPKTRRIVAR